MSQPTPALAELAELDVAHVVHRHGPVDTSRAYGVAVAAALGIPTDRACKTLVALVDDRPVAVVLPVSRRLAPKRLAKAASGRRAQLADAATAERLTGYVVGGISPFGMRRRLPVWVDRRVLDQPTVFVSAGRRGLQVELAPTDLVDATGAIVADLADQSSNASLDPTATSSRPRGVSRA